MENEVMENEEVMEPEVDIAEEESGNSAIGFGLAVAIGRLLARLSARSSGSAVASAVDTFVRLIVLYQL